MYLNLKSTDAVFIQSMKTKYGTCMYNTNSSIKSKERGWKHKKKKTKQRC